MRPLALLFALACSYASFSQDLIITDITGPKSFTQYTTVSASVTVKNQGIVSDYSQASVSFYLSTDGITASGANMIGTATVPVLAANESKTVSISVAQQIRAIPGAYYLIAIVDPNNYVQETDDTNNRFSIAGYIITAPDVDFSFTSLVVNTPSQAVHATAKITYGLLNSGATNIEGKIGTSSSSVTVSFWISSDNVVDNSDVVVTSQSFTLSGTVDSGTRSVDFEIPAIIPGNYNVLARADQPNAYIETDETNNNAAGQITIMASDIDIGVDEVEYPLPYSLTYPPDSIRSPDAEWDLQPVPGLGSHLMVAINVVLRNYGTSGFNSLQHNLYLSTDQVLDGTDIQTSTYYDDIQMAGGDSIPRRFYSTYIDQFVYGEYYVILELNPDHAISETDYSNNIVVSRNKINVQYPGIMFTAASLAGTYTDIDTELNLSVSLEGQFDATEILGFYDKYEPEYFHPTYNYTEFYLVEIKGDNCPTCGNAMAWAQQTIHFGKSMDVVTSTANWNILLPQPLPAGNYIMTLKCDNISMAGCFTYNEFTLPLVIAPVFVPKYKVSGQTIGEDGPAISKGKLFLYQKKDDGKVQFIQKITPTTSKDFDFLNVDFRQHTLYFIPDPANYSEYAPTILGKTVTLQESNYFSLTQDTYFNFEILRLQPLAAGDKTISGNVITASSSALMSFFSLTALEADEPIPVVLLNDAGDPVAVTQTDNTGFYEFRNLPSDNYQLVVALELDDPGILDEPFEIDVSTESKEVNFDLSSPDEEITVRKQQIINVTPPTISYGDPQVTLNATGSSGLPVVYYSADNSVATITNNVLKPLKAGTLTITATQSGDANYSDAQAEFTITIAKAKLTVTAFDNSRYYGDDNPSFSLRYTGFKNNETVGVLSRQPDASTTATKTSDAGVSDILVRNGLADNYAFEYQYGKLTVAKAPLFVTALNCNVPYNATEPVLPVSYTGFKNGESMSVLNVVPVVSSPTLKTANAGTTHDIIVSGGSDNNYSFVYTNATATVVKSNLSVTADNKVRKYREANPSLSFRINGFKYGEDATNSGVTLPVLSTTATQESNAGVYPIQLTGGAGSVNYNLIVQPGILVIEKLDQAITFNIDVNRISFDASALALAAKSSSDLPVSFSIIEGKDIASLSSDGKTLVWSGKAGNVTVAATQAGNVNYREAPRVTRTIAVVAPDDLVLGIDDGYDGVFSVAPNPATTDVVVTLTARNMNALAVYNSLGAIIYSSTLDTREHRIDVSDFNAGIYIVKVSFGDGLVRMRKVMVLR
jgi:hypothetical protein